MIEKAAFILMSLDTLIVLKHGDHTYISGPSLSFPISPPRFPIMTRHYDESIPCCVFGTDHFTLRFEGSFLRTPDIDCAIIFFSASFSRKWRFNKMSPLNK